MNDLIGNNYQPSNDQLKAKKWMKIISVILVLLFFICIGLVAFMYYWESTQLKTTIDGKENANLQSILLIQNGQVYVPIRQFAEFVGYESYSGDYKQYAEDETKCYVKSTNEIASFSMNSDKIYKLLSNGNDYEYFTINEPVKMINGVLYTTKEGAERAFNIVFEYSQEQYKIAIYTLPYLVTQYSAQFKDSAIAGGGANFSNQKALLEDRLIVKNAENYYGVSDLSGNEILGTKYTSIKYVESTREFIVTTAEGKMGIMSYDATTKISPDYDQIKQIDKDAGLYLVTNSNKHGVINNSGNIIVYLEYDQIGIDANRFNSNNIKNQYLLYDNCIPVKKGNLWGIFDKNGRQILPIEYEDLGCSAGAGNATTQTANSIILIPDYKGIVVKKDNLYGVKDFEGKELIPIALKTIYSTVSAGEETYYMVYNEQVMNVITYIQTYVRPNKNQPEDNKTNTTNTENNNETTNGNNTVTNETNTNSSVTDNNTQSTNANVVDNTQVTNSQVDNQTTNTNQQNTNGTTTQTNQEKNNTTTTE
ncbi:MAG: hypothetical protein HFJ29_05785 [Clostridia bacterium]|nr:hypothetical protein [Clostridia bacterium]